MIKHPDQRVAVFVDVQNMYHSAKNLYEARVNFQAILDAAVADRKLIRAIAYVIRSESVEEEIFFEALDKQGFEVKMKDIQVFAGGAKKADWDIGMAVDALTLAGKVDSVVLVTGDGDFAPLVSYLRENKGSLVEMMAFGKTASSILVDMVDDFTDLGEDKGRFLMKMPKAKRKTTKRTN